VIRVIELNSKYGVVCNQGFMNQAHYCHEQPTVFADLESSSSIPKHQFLIYKNQQLLLKRSQLDILLDCFREHFEGKLVVLPEEVVGK